MNTGPFKRFVVLLFLFNVIEPLHGVGNAVGIFIAEGIFQILKKRFDM